MSASNQIDYDALAKQAGSTASSAPSATPQQAPAAAPQNGGVDYDALARAAGSTASTAAPTSTASADVDFSNSADGIMSPPSDASQEVAGPAPSKFASDTAATIDKAVMETAPSVKGIAKSIWHSLPPVQLADSTKQVLPVINAYHQARENGASVPDAIKAADIQARQQDAVGQAIQQRVAEFKKNPTQEGIRAVVDASMLGLQLYGGSELGGSEAEVVPSAEESASADAAFDASKTAPEPEAATAQAPSSPSLIDRGKTLYQQVTKGAAANQPEAQAAIRGSAQSAAEDAGVANQVTLDPKAGIRTLADDSIAAVKQNESGLYDKINEAAGTDLKTHYEKLAKINDAIEASVDPAEEAKLEAARSARLDAIQEGEQQATENGVDPDTLKHAEALTQQRYAMQEFKAKVLNNEGVVKGNVSHGAPESIDVDSAITNAEKLNKPSKFAPEGTPTRLEQALGKDGASNLLKNLYSAQKAGVAAVKAQKIAKWVGATIGLGTVEETARHLL
jgi:hypothetical protein